MFSDKFSDTIPYAMIQIQMSNRRKYKCVAVNGKIKFVSVIKCKGFHSFSHNLHTEFLKIAQVVCDQYQQKCIGAICDNILRADIFINANGEFKLNEIEGFEAFNL